MTTAILSLQGAFAEHAAMLDELGEPWFELRCLRNMSRHFDRLILPGGESTVQGRLLREEGMLPTIRTLIEEGMPVLGTCAGLILLAERVIDEGGDDRSSGPKPIWEPCASRPSETPTAASSRAFTRRTNLPASERCR